MYAREITAREVSQITYCIEYCLLKRINANITKKELSASVGTVLSFIRKNTTKIKDKLKSQDGNSSILTH
jgi:hypothetical protein